ncbi:hypothetical protein CPLU01_13698 [Colletotrichum plurivorum]|uniref:Uncharacterized protein n=1 Tax=Colletotrichum plurivorum TaxID=2175906 RepID=A0A8H6JPQ4_9PEZI|nr:hypothetical protein CPLU01_13698 [Colletotrichum plurivorum]
MFLNDLFRCLIILSIAGGAFSHPYHEGRNDYAHQKRHPLVRQQPISNITRPVSSTQAPITPDPRSSTRISSSFTTIGTSSAQPSTSTVSGGEIVVAIIGATYVAGAGGATLMVGGTAHALAAGAIVTITGGGANGDTPEIETVSSPNPTQNPRTSDPATQPASTSAPFSPTPTSSAAPTSSVTSSSTASPTPYIILTSQNSTKEEIQNINSTLAQEATPNSLSEIISDRTGLVVFFKAAISSIQAEAIGKQPGVAGVTPDERLEEEQPPNSSAPPTSATRHTSATGPPGSPKTSLPNPADIRLQSDALDELKVISQPAGANLADLPGYGYPAEAGKGVTIYVIDTGANAQNTEWTGMPGKKGFMYAPGASQEETDFLNHGSCVASKAGGPAYGTAKDADMIAVKLPSDLSISAIFTALVEISNDVFQKKLEGKAVQFGVDDVTEYPALFGPDTDIIVVGAVENDGYRAFFSQGTGSQLTVSAPGFVDCASGRSSGSQELYGTSFGKVAANVKAMVQAMAYSRIEGEPAVIWNGIDPRGLACSGGTNGKRQAAPSGGNCQVTSAAPSSMATSTPPTSTASIAPTSDTPSSTAPSTSTSAQPSPPPKPTWSDNPQGFIKVFEQDGVASAFYDASSDSASEGITSNIEAWCLGKCADSNDAGVAFK